MHYMALQPQYEKCIVWHYSHCIALHDRDIYLYIEGVENSERWSQFGHLECVLVAMEKFDAMSVSSGTG